MNILEKILEVKKEEILHLRKRYKLNSFSNMEFFEEKSLSFKNEITKDSDISIIAEIKKASPSKGIIQEDFNHMKIAEEYLENGVNAISILTDKKFFSGSIKLLSDIAKIKSVPLLRKDFIIDEYQVYEAKASGADIILLICEALSGNQINALSNAAYEIGLEVLLELHSESQLNKIDFKLNPVIGVNNRNLEDFSVSLETTAKLSEMIPAETILVSESGINKKEDIEFLKQINTDAVLVGEHLMKFKNTGEGVKQLKEWCSNEG